MFAKSPQFYRKKLFWFASFLGQIIINNVIEAPCGKPLLLGASTHLKQLLERAQLIVGGSDLRDQLGVEKSVIARSHAL